jgi:hypothetical protein
MELWAMRFELLTKPFLRRELHPDLPNILKWDISLGLQHTATTMMMAWLLGNESKLNKQHKTSYLCCVYKHFRHSLP